ncbi:IS701 family transposase [Haloglycomyces albus]|uniref:IS701 family transposase n=1 Tax=Haloglycomyces albus TaxID=526067 RepID=UPI0006854CE6|nr:transposase [Haloglycomyces albus]
MTEENKAAAAQASIITDVHEDASDRVFSALSSQFKRPETFWNAQTYTQGLMSELASKNAWTISEWAGHATPDRLQYLLERACWDEAAVRSTLGEITTDVLGTGGILVFDETGHVKKGTHTLGVQRQYTGTAGRTENAQVHVWAAWKTDRGFAPLDVAVYLPQSWCADSGRRAAAGIDEDVEFATKGQMAAAMTATWADRIGSEAISAATGNAVYGQSPDLKDELWKQQIPFVLAVKATTRIRTRPPTASRTSRTGHRLAPGRLLADPSDRTGRQRKAHLPVGDGHLRRPRPRGRIPLPAGSRKPLHR